MRPIIRSLARSPGLAHARPLALALACVAALTCVLDADAYTMSRRAGRLGFHGAIAWHAPTESIGYSYDFRTSRDARRAALVQCAHPECEVLIHVRNACAVALHQGPKFFAADGATYDEARMKARRKCAGTCDELAWVCTK